MGYARTLDRAIDGDLVARLLNGVKAPVPPAKRLEMPRVAESYRGARRNVGKRFWQGAEVRMAWDWPQPIRLNRSRHLPSAASYAEARARGGKS